MAAMIIYRINSSFFLGLSSFLGNHSKFPRGLVTVVSLRIGWRFPPSKLPTGTYVSVYPHTAAQSPFYLIAGSSRTPRGGQFPWTKVTMPRLEDLWLWEWWDSTHLRSANHRDSGRKWNCFCLQGASGLLGVENTHIIQNQMEKSEQFRERCHAGSWVESTHD